MRLILLNIVRFFFLVLLQVFIISKFNLGFLTGYISIAVYISFILTFPTRISKYITVVIAFFLGLTIDMFLNTHGIHASACVFLSFIRPYLLNRLQTESPMDEIDELTIYTEDAQKYILYTFILSLGFFFWLFMIEEFSFVKIPVIILKTILSSIVSTILIIIGQYLLFRKQKN